MSKIKSPLRYPGGKSRAIKQILPPSSTTVPPAVVGNKPSIPVRQTIRITNNNLGVKKLLMKLKVSFTIKGEKKEHMTTFSGFPDGF